MDIAESVQAILSSKERVIERFYDRFLCDHPHLRGYFEMIDLHVQASMVTISLVAVEAYYANRLPATEHYFQVLGHRHYHAGVPAGDLFLFRDSLLETLCEFHAEDWSETLANDWSDALDVAIILMRDGYENEYTF